MSRWARISLRWLLAILLLAGSIGCGSSEPPLYPVRGKVFYKGKPIPKALLVFHPQFDGPGWMPVATVEEDGSFSASTRKPGDGALAGRYKVSIVWHPRATDDDPGPNLLPARYASAETSRIDIEAGPNSGDLPPIQLLP